MKIETKEYEVADISANPEAIHVIRQAESEISAVTGSNITLIAYTKDPNPMEKKEER